MNDPHNIRAILLPIVVVAMFVPRSLNAGTIDAIPGFDSTLSPAAGLVSGGTFVSDASNLAEFTLVLLAQNGTVGRAVVLATDGGVPVGNPLWQGPDIQWPLGLPLRADGYVELTYQPSIPLVTGETYFVGIDFGLFGMGFQNQIFHVGGAFSSDPIPGGRAWGYIDGGGWTTLGTAATDIAARIVMGTAYRYVGNTFNLFSCTGNTRCSTPDPAYTAYTTDNFVAATLTLNEPLPAHLTLHNVRGLPGFGLTMNDGHQNLTLGPGVPGEAIVSTDAEGHIVGPWSVFINCCLFPNNSVFSLNWPNVRGVGDGGALSAPNGSFPNTPRNSGEVVPGSPGVWQDDSLPDRDEDGVPDSDDACPDLAGDPANKGCPADGDGDGVFDFQDACPDLAGNAENKGCPSDRDGDSVFDFQDECPDRAGEIENKGCPTPPSDRDGDGILDSLDACPDVYGMAAHDGCPAPRRPRPATRDLVLVTNTFFGEPWPGAGYPGPVVFHRVFASALITNLGPDTASNFSVEFEFRPLPGQGIPGAHVHRVNVAELAAGQSIWVRTSRDASNLGTMRIDPGSYTLTTVVDPSDLVAETDESNNVYVRSAVFLP